MKRARGSKSMSGLRQALDEVRFGAGRILNLRDSLPTAADATARAESWLRQQQVQRAGEVLVITGRGNNSVDGVPIVKQAVEKLLGVLKRRGVVESFRAHTPGSYAITLAPVRHLWEAPLRHRDRKTRQPPSDPVSLAGLDAETRQLLRELAERSLGDLGVHDRERFLESEMLTQFSAIARGVPECADREARLREAIRLALWQDDEP